MGKIQNILSNSVFGSRHTYCTDHLLKFQNSWKRTHHTNQLFNYSTAVHSQRMKLVHIHNVRMKPSKVRHVHETLLLAHVIRPNAPISATFITVYAYKIEHLPSHSNTILNIAKITINSWRPFRARMKLLFSHVSVRIGEDGNFNNYHYLDKRDIISIIISASCGQT